MYADGCGAPRGTRFLVRYPTGTGSQASMQRAYPVPAGPLAAFAWR